MSPFRHSIRLLLKSPAFTITAVVVLGFATGANTAIFSLIDTVILRPLPYPNPERMVAVSMPTAARPNSGLDYPDYLIFCARQHRLFRGVSGLFAASITRFPN